MSHSGVTQSKIPKDAQVIISILKEIGIQDYEPRVVNQLLEFTYRYVTCILDDAKVYANHAKKKVIDAKDVKLASQMMLDKAFTNPPARDVLFEVAKAKNSTPLPLVKINCGLRLPPDRYCLSACNYKLRAASQPKKMVKSALESRSGIKTTFKPSTIVQTTVKKPVTAMPKTQTVTIPKPTFKFTTQAKISFKPKTEGITKMETDDGDSGKRKRDEEDDFEIVQ
ncbi:transcription initiation factor TFIID subunit 9 [Culicoides brevitarsis]|uniref:transcription initiation factor TFIID subunit 9 n=1 Tax=Culicoides brevitarsis TaxID=469753 RepID=UPI00307C2DE7